MWECCKFGMINVWKLCTRCKVDHICVKWNHLAVVLFAIIIRSTCPDSSSWPLNSCQLISLPDCIFPDTAPLKATYDTMTAAIKNFMVLPSSLGLPPPPGFPPVFFALSNVVFAVLSIIGKMGSIVITWMWYYGFNLQGRGRRLERRERKCDTSCNL